MKIGCAILAGGRSSRMGRDKATLRVRERLLIERVFNVVRPVFRNISIVSSYHDGISGIDAPIYGDLLPVRSPLVGIASALVYARDPYVFVVACDMPFLSEEALRYVISELDGEDLVIPRTDKGYEALHAIYGRTCIAPMLRAIEVGRLKVRDIFPYLTVKELADHPSFTKNGASVFTNINTVDDLELLAGLEGWEA
jgi:molybdenum cofactor guanylyltransferase